MTTGSYLARRAIYQSQHLDESAGRNAEPRSESRAVPDGAIRKSEEKQPTERSRNEEAGDDSENT